MTTEDNCKIPKYVRCVSEFPLTGSGKARNQELREMAMNEFKKGNKNEGHGRDAAHPNVGQQDRHLCKAGLFQPACDLFLPHTHTFSDLSEFSQKDVNLGY
jgi:hypothetical protein